MACLDISRALRVLHECQIVHCVRFVVVLFIALANCDWCAGIDVDW